MTTMQVGKRLVELCQANKHMEAIDELYHQDIDSIEAGGGSEKMPAHQKGVQAVRAKANWWFSNHIIHGGTAKGPFPHGDRFAVIFTMDITPLAGPMKDKRFQMEEVGLYTVANGMIVKEEFFYAMG